MAMVLVSSTVIDGALKYFVRVGLEYHIQYFRHILKSTDNPRRIFMAIVHEIERYLGNPLAPSSQPQEKVTGNTSKDSLL